MGSSILSHPNKSLELNFPYFPFFQLKIRAIGISTKFKP